MTDIAFSIAHASDAQIRAHAYSAADACLGLDACPFTDPAKAEKWCDAYFARAQHNLREAA
jgi:hypothetical protein